MCADVFSKRPNLCLYRNNERKENYSKYYNLLQLERKLPITRILIMKDYLVQRGTS